MAAEILDPNGIPLEDTIFLELIRPNIPIPWFITELTTITNNMVGIAERFPKVAGNFLEFMQQHSNKYPDGHDNVCIKHIILAAHNGKVFDIPFLMQQLSVNGMIDLFLQDKRFGLALDMLQLARKSIQ
jgi:DNA polymerase III epsilon subunit-like protein